MHIICVNRMNLSHAWVQGPSCLEPNSRGLGVRIFNSVAHDSPQKIIKIKNAVVRQIVDCRTRHI